MVRGESLSEESLYLELEYVPANLACDIESLLTHVYSLSSPEVSK